jgi:drug/metabolite transporter (DMT)-like permease
MKPSPKLKLSKILIADLQILGSALFLGIGFLGQRSVSIYGLGPMTCNSFRFGLSTLLLAACLPLLPQGFGNENEDDSSDDNLDVNEMKKVMSINNSSSFYKILGPFAAHIAVAKKNVWFWGIILGFINFGGSGFQQWGISFTSASKVAFIAGFDLFLTPIFSMIIPTLKRNNKILPSTWLAIGISLFGLFFLSETSLDDPIGLGEILTLISTAFWTLYIIYTDIATNYVDSISLMCIQFGVVTILSAIAAFFYEPQQWLWDHFFIFLPWILFLAFTEGVGFTLMAIGNS